MCLKCRQNVGALLYYVLYVEWMFASNQNVYRSNSTSNVMIISSFIMLDMSDLSIFRTGCTPTMTVSFVTLVKHWHIETLFVRENKGFLFTGHKREILTKFHSWKGYGFARNQYIGPHLVSFCSINVFFDQFGPRMDEISMDTACFLGFPGTIKRSKV